MRILHARTFAIPNMTTSLAPWRPSNSPCTPVVKWPGFGGVFKRSNHPSRRQHKSSRTVVWASGNFYSSEVVRQEMERLNKDVKVLLSLMAKFPDFDLEGKRIFIQQVDQLAERAEIHYTRLRLADGPEMKDIVRQLDVQCLEASFSLKCMVEGFKQRAEVLRQMLEEEERTSDPVKLRALREAMRASFPRQRVANLPPLEDLTDEDQVAMQDPKALAAFDEVTENPLALEKYRDRPALYNFLKKLV